MVVDPGSDGNAVETVRAHAGARRGHPRDQLRDRPRRRRTRGQPLPRGPRARSTDSAHDAVPRDAVEHVWVLTSDTAADPHGAGPPARRRPPLARRSGPPAPSCCDWDAPGALGRSACS